MKKLYFVRHGLTEMNVANIFSGQVETPLVEEGRAQATAAGRDLQARGVSFDKIIASPLSRAHDTARLIAAEIGYPEDRIITTPLLLERSFGILEGTFAPDFFDAHVYQDIDNVPGAETIEQLQTRAQQALDFLHTIDADTVLVVSHGAFGRAFRRVVQNQPHIHEYTNPLVQIKNCEIIELL